MKTKEQAGPVAKHEPGTASITGNSICTQNEKELSFEDTSLKFKNNAGQWRISLRQLAEYYKISFNHASAKLTSNSDLFRDLVTGRVTGPKRGTVSDYELSIRDAVSFLTLLDYKRYDNERKGKLIRMRNWLTDTAEKVLTGDLVLRSEVESLFDPSTLTDSPRAIAKDNNLRRALFIKKARETHPESPNTFKRLHDLAHNDQQLVEGPEVQFKQGWHRKLSSDLSLKDHAQKMASFAAIACGHIEIEDINRFERDLFQGLPEKYIPDHIPGLIETTKQMKLIGGAEA